MSTCSNRSYKIVLSEILVILLNEFYFNFYVDNIKSDTVYT